MKTFAKHSFNLISLSPRTKDVGNYQVFIFLRNKNTNKIIGNPQKFNIEVIKPPIFSFNCHLGPKIDYCLPYIKQVSDSGQVTIKFPLGIKEVNTTSYPNITNALRIELYVSKDIDGNQRVVNSTIKSWNVTNMNNDTI